MPGKRKVFAHPKAILLKFEEYEFLAIEEFLREERQKRPHLARTELLREWILAHVQKEKQPLSDKPVPCRFCGHLQPENKLQKHEENCGLNPDSIWVKEHGKQKPSPVILQQIELRRWWDAKLADVEARFTCKIEVLEQFLFRDRVWFELYPLEQERLLRFFLNPAIGAAPRQFRPVQFKGYLARLGVIFDEAQIDGFLRQQVGQLLAKNDQSFYMAIR